MAKYSEQCHSGKHWYVESSDGNTSYWFHSQVDAENFARDYHGYN